MSDTAIISIVATTIALFTLIGKGIKSVIELTTKFNQLDLDISSLKIRVDTLTDCLLRRAISEGINKGIITQNSPIAITEQGREYFSEELKIELKNYYKTTGYLLSYKELFLEIERIFGERILKEICIPHNLYASSCVLAAIEIAREGCDHSDSHIMDLDTTLSENSCGDKS